MAIQGLWSVPWLMEVEGTSRAVAARHLLRRWARAMLAGYLVLGVFATPLARRGIHARHLFAGGYALNLLALAAIVAAAARRLPLVAGATASAPSSTCSPSPC